MTKLLIDAALRWRMSILLGSLVVIILGTISVLHLPINAFPDVSPTLVRVFVEVNATAAEEVERLVTSPIEAEMRKIRGVKRVKSVSSYGLSTIRIYFDDAMDIDRARQLVNERITLAEEQIPDSLDIPHGIEMGAVSSGTGKILAYYLQASDMALIELRTLQDRTIKPFLEDVEGVSEVLSQGGFVQQVRVDVDPARLEQFGMTVSEVIERIRKSNMDVGGGLLKVDDEEWIVRSLGRIESIDELRSVFLKEHQGNIVLLADVADVEIGPAERRGVASIDGDSEIVTGSVYKAPGSNSFKIIQALTRRIDELNTRLPGGVRVVPYYDQGLLVTRSIDTVKNALLMGLLLVAVVSVAFLRKLKNSILVLMAIPFSMLFSFIVLRCLGMSGDLISLGGLAIGLGMIVDASIIMVEKIHYNTQNLKTERHIGAIIRDSYAQVARPIMFSISIIIIVFLPIWTLQGVEGKMFRPLVISVTVAMFASLLYALVVIPACFSLFSQEHVDRSGDGDEAPEGVMLRLYRKAVTVCVSRRWLVAIAFVMILAAGVTFFRKIGKVFMPIMEEGTIHVVAHMDPNISLDRISALSREIEKEILTFDEVKYAVTDIGYGDVGPHVHHTNYASVTVGFHPKHTWKDSRTQDDVIEKIYQRLVFFPANSISFTQPIQHEVDDLISGSGSQIVVKLFGNDMDQLKRVGAEIKESLGRVDGARDLYVDQIAGQTQLRIDIDRAKLAQFRLDMADVQQSIRSAIGGERVGKMFTKDGHSDICVRVGEGHRGSPEQIRDHVVHRAGEQAVRVRDIASVERDDGLMQISREKGQRYIKIQCNVRGRDVGGFIDEAQDRIGSDVTIPAGYYITWGGQFELQRAANQRFMIVVPITLLVVVLLLFVFHGNGKEMALIFLNIPFSVVGGIACLYALGQDLSIPSTIGFIALFGIALQDSLVLVNRFNYLLEKGHRLEDAVIEGCVSKMRPVLMTTLTTALALVPLVFSTGVGAEIQRPLAIVVVGGLLSSTVLTLFIIPTFYMWTFGASGRKAASA